MRGLEFPGSQEKSDFPGGSEVQGEAGETSGERDPERGLWLSREKSSVTPSRGRPGSTAGAGGREHVSGDMAPMPRPLPESAHHTTSICWLNPGDGLPS